METETLDDEAEADHQKKAKAENDHGRVFRHEGHQRPRCRHHHGHGHADGGNHHPEIIDHANGSDDAVEREDGVEHDDLHDDLPEDRMHHLALFRLLVTLQPFVQFHRALGEQEGTAEDEDEIATGKGEIRNGEKRPRQRDDPRDRKQQQQAHDERKRQADHSRLLALVRRQLVGKDRDEDEIVDAEHDFENDKGDEADPYIRICEEFHVQEPLWEWVQTRKAPDRPSEAESRCFEKNKNIRGWRRVLRASLVRCRLLSVLSPSSGIGRIYPTISQFLCRSN